MEKLRKHLIKKKKIKILMDGIIRMQNPSMVVANHPRMVELMIAKKKELPVSHFVLMIQSLTQQKRKQRRKKKKKRRKMQKKLHQKRMLQKRNLLKKPSVKLMIMIFKIQNLK